MRYLLIISLLMLPACVGKKKSLCLDIADGGHAHIELGYFYDSTEATVTGPLRVSTMTDDATSNPCGMGERP